MGTSDLSHKVYQHLLIILFLTVVAGVLSTRLDLFEYLMHYFHAYEAFEFDELFLTAVILLIMISGLSYDLYALAEKESLELANSNKNLSNIFDSSNDLICVIGSDGAILNTNKISTKILGYNEDELLKLCIEDIVSTKKELALIKDKRAVNDQTLLEVNVIHKNGTEKPVEISVSSFFHKNQYNKLLIIRDIAERKKARKLLQAKREADGLNRIKSDFLSNVSHELRTPLNSIIGFSQLLDSKVAGDLNEQQSRYLDNILKSEQRLLELVNGFLDLSKIELGKMELYPERTNLGQIIAESKLLVQAKATKKFIDIEGNIEDNYIELNADRTKLVQVLYHLLDNAIKFTPANGNVSIMAKKHDDIIHLFISDNGVGISDTDQELIFAPF
ncbi:PAS domain S-box protein [Methanococcoides sp. SA1]|nr:PAS domain S-box protein [Methanococcoides sp. SA1]